MQRQRAGKWGEHNKRGESNKSNLAQVTTSVSSALLLALLSVAQGMLHLDLEPLHNFLAEKIACNVC